MRKYVIMGPQGSGKGTQAGLLARGFDLVHISVGDIFRWHVQNRTKLGTRVQRYMNEGRLVPDEMVSDDREVAARDPRLAPRLRARRLPAQRGADRVLPRELRHRRGDRDRAAGERAIERIQSRRLCSSCGLDYNLIQLRPHVASVCDNCGGRLVTRDDDTPEAIRTRLAEYREKTRPILDLLREKELIVTVDGTPTPDVVQAEIRRKLGLAQSETEAGAAGRSPR